MTPKALLDAVSALGYRPTVEGAVSAVADGPTATVRACAQAVKAGADGEVVVTLTPKEGNRLGGEGQAATKVVVVGTDAVTVANGEAKVAEAVTAAREVKLAIKVAAGAKAGEQTVVVRVTLQARKGAASEAEQTVELRVPVVVQ